MDQLLSQLRATFTAFAFKPGPVFCWSPESQEIIYCNDAEGSQAAWSLLHETSHALLNHRSYKTDFELLSLEVAAWEYAKVLATNYGILIDEDHIQNCLDSYRDWLYARSICPSCSNKSLQQSDLRYYKCFNCHTIWQVTPSRFCRAYRATKNYSTTLPSGFDALITL